MNGLNVSTLTDAETKVSDFALRAKLKRHLPCHYVLLLQHPSDLEEVTSRENANLLTIKQAV